jgi:NADPH-dependent 2,4-dienoyl-CoA reductase/sulfur reductase-like enzyme
MRILVLGAGVGGQVAANELRRSLPGEHRVTLIERDVRHAFAPSFLWVMTGDRQPHQVTRDVRHLVRPGVDVRIGEIGAIDVANRRVAVDRESLEYDYLIVALGAELAPDAIPGLAAASHTFYTLSGATRLRGALDHLTGGLAGVAFGDFFHEPSPDVQVKSLGKAWHLGKVLFERWWLSRWGIRRRLLKSALAIGSRIYGVPVRL